MKTKFLLMLLAISLCFSLLLSPCVFADEYDMFDDDDFEEMYDDDDVDYDDYDDDLYPEFEEDIIWFFFVIFELITPAALAVVGFVISRSEKRKYPKYWLIFSGICIAWIVFSIILMIMLM